MTKHALPKQSVGRPKKDGTAPFLNPKVERMKPFVSKPRGNYQNWFIFSLWPPIFKAMQQTMNITTALMYLRAVYRQPRSSHNSYEHLAKGTMYECFYSNDDLKENYKRCVELDTYFDNASQHCLIFSDYHALRDEICNVLRKQRAGGQLSTFIIQPLIKKFIQKHEPQLLEDEKFQDSTKWARIFIKSKLNWSYRAATTAAGKLSNDFELQGLTMTQMCTYLIKVHNILESLVVNSDQTGIHLVPTGGART